MDNLLLQFINDPYNDTINFELAYSYEEIGQTASALSYYLRCAEFTKNDDLAYECLIRMSLCLSKQGTRETMELICIQHALSIRPDRPEANYLMSLYYSFREKWLDSYMFACNGLINNKNNELVLRKPFLYFDRYQLLFQKAYSGYNKGKLKESYKIYQDLLTDNKIKDNYRTIISNNLKNYPENMKKNDHNILPKEQKIGVDVGACIGETIDYFKDYDLIYAIEPSPEEFNILKEKYENDKRIIPIQCAISDKDGEEILNCYENGRFSSFLEFNKDGKFYGFCEQNVESFDTLKERITVQTMRLDTFMDKYKIDHIDYLKIDTQGTDLKVVQSLGNELDKVDTIQMEVQLQELYENSFTKEEVVKYMNDNNFKLIDTNYGEISKEYEQDFIFKNNKKKKSDNIKMIINDDMIHKIDIDIVLQGKYNENVIPIAEYYLELDFVNNIIISCWEGDNVPEITNDRIIVIKNEVPQQVGSGNKNLQIISSLNGLKKAETEFAIKIRNDQRYTHESMNKMYTFYEEYKEKKLSFYYDEKKPKNRICVLGNFAEFSFHPRDHLFWGNREDLIDLFALPLDTWAITDKIKFIQPEDYALYYEHFIRSETYIGAHYLANFNRTINYYLLDPKKYLYDNSEKYYETKNLSDQLTPQVFKAFPREGIDLEWYKYGWKTYPYDTQRDNFGERWHEDGL